MIERSLHIGAQTRTLRCTAKTLIVFKAWMPGNIGLREALYLHRDPGTVAIAIAAFLRHKDGDEKITPARVASWIDNDPAKYPEIENAAVVLCEAYFRATGMLTDEDAATGEAPRATPPAPSSTSGTTSSVSQGDGASTPEPSKI